MILDVFAEDFHAIFDFIVVVVVLIKVGIVTGIMNQIILALFMFSKFLRQAFLDLFCPNL